MTCRSSLGLVVLMLGMGVVRSAEAQPPAAAPGPLPAPGVTPPAADQTQQPSEEAPPRVPWRGTMLEWMNSATTTMLGVGDDVIGHDADAYSMAWRLTLKYHLVDLDALDVSVTTQPTWAVELTNSDTSTTKHETQFLDLPLTGTLGYKINGGTLYSTVPTYTTGLMFPTWLLSRNNGTQLTLSNRLGVSQSIPILGEDSPALKSISVKGLLRWDRRFSQAETPVNAGLERPRQTLTGASFLDDQLSGTRLARDTVRELVSLAFSEAIAGMPLGLSFDFLFSQQFKPELGATTCVQIDTGCATVASSADAPNSAHYYSFGTTLEFQPVPELAVAVSYASSGSPLGQNTLAEDGKRRGFFYAPDAEFGAQLTFFPDALYERISGPRRAMAENRGTKRAF